MLRLICRLILLTFLASLFACKQNAELLGHRSKYVDPALGELPPMPDGQFPAAQPEFFRLMSSAGKMRRGVLKVNSALRVGAEGQQKDFMCPLAEKQVVHLVASIKSNTGRTYVIANLGSPCSAQLVEYGEDQAGPEPKRAVEMTEGYILAVEVDEDEDGESGNEPTPSPSPSPSETPSPTPEPEPVYSGCQQVVQANSNVSTQHCDSVANPNACSMPGASFRENNISIDLLIKGSAKKWVVKTKRIMATRDSSGSTAIPDKTFDADSVAIMAPTDDFKTKIPFNQFIINNNWRSSSVEMTVVGLNQEDQEVGSPCLHNLRIVSPVVLDFSGASMLTTTSPIDSKVNFDMDADGKVERSGWILPTAGFLAMDRNGNGKIDDASELFGEHTDNKRYKNGYEALSTLDSIGLGLIDQDNKAFHKLVVWIDANVDGISQKEEVKSLRAMGITKISTRYKKVYETETVGFSNRIVYESRFFGPKQCGIEGCKSYDVFFATISDLMAEKK